MASLDYLFLLAALWLLSPDAAHGGHVLEGSWNLCLQGCETATVNSAGTASIYVKKLGRRISVSLERDGTNGWKGDTVADYYDDRCKTLPVDIDVWFTAREGYYDVKVKYHAEGNAGNDVVAITETIFNPTRWGKKRRKRKRRRRALCEESGTYNGQAERIASSGWSVYCGGYIYDSGKAIAYPRGGVYSNGEDCTWRIRRSKPFYVYFKAVVTESCCDKISIDGQEKTGSSVAQQRFYSTNNEMDIRFKSDGSVVRNGFIATIGDAPPFNSYCVSSGNTNGWMYASRDRGISISSSLYRNDMRCTWWIYSSTSFSLRLNRFDVEYDSSCGYDYLQVRYSSKRCGYSSSGSVFHFSSGWKKIYFHTDGSVTEGGFELEIIGGSRKRRDVIGQVDVVAVQSQSIGNDTKTQKPTTGKGCQCNLGEFHSSLLEQLQGTKATVQIYKNFKTKVEVLRFSVIDNPDYELYKVLKANGTENGNQTYRQELIKKAEHLRSLPRSFEMVTNITECDCSVIIQPGKHLVIHGDIEDNKVVHGSIETDVSDNEGVPLEMIQEINDPGTPWKNLNTIVIAVVLGVCVVILIVVVVVLWRRQRKSKVEEVTGDSIALPKVAVVGTINPAVEKTVELSESDEKVVA